MNVLFLTIIRIDNISDRGIYPDLMRKFRNEGHKVFIVTPVERRLGKKSEIIADKNSVILKIRTLNIQKSSFLEKWAGMLLIQYQYLLGIIKYFRREKFDLIIYSTPPITFLKIIRFIKLKHGAASYLLLKDIFPQNAVDLGLIRKNGLINKYFAKKEKDLYSVSDYIGCMSKANVDFILKANPEIDNKKLEINPNTHEILDDSISTEEKLLIRKRYGIPENSIIFIFGGNLGRPQGVSFMLDFLESQMQKKGIFFVIAGNGTEFKRLKLWFEMKQPENSKLIFELPKADYNMLLKSCDIGMIFLDRRFTIPNFPSRLLYYMEYRMPVLAATDLNTDISNLIMENNFGLWSEAGDLMTIDFNVDLLQRNESIRKTMGVNGFNFLKENFTVENSYNLIMNHFPSD